MGTQIDVASDNPANSAFLWGSGGYVVHYTNCTAAAPSVISDACINASTLVQCYSEGVAASIPPPPAPPTPPAPAAPSDGGPPPVSLQIILPSVLLGRRRATALQLYCPESSGGFTFPQ